MSEEITDPEEIVNVLSELMGEIQNEGYETISLTVTHDNSHEVMSRSTFTLEVTY